MLLLKTIPEIRSLVQEQKKLGKKIGLVPTMGALHKAHLSLVEIAAKESDFVIVYIFVNALQFNNPKDLEIYPRNLEKDLESLKSTRTNAVFAPDVSEIYPQGDMLVNTEQRSSRVIAGNRSNGLCGATRPGHFNGVVTVLAKFFNIIQPDVAVFGDKDYQQLRVIRQMVADLFFPIKIIAGPIIRDPDSLALSSRNVLLSPADREHALLIPRTLFAAQKLVKEGLTAIDKIKDFVRTGLTSTQYLKPDYIEITDCESLVPITGDIKKEAQLLIATFCGEVRLIDNVKLSLN